MDGLDYLIYIIILLAGLAMGCFICFFIVNRINKSNFKPNTFIPEQIKGLTENQARAIELYQAEWKVVLETQMHFNDLIIRFRGLTLTGFAVLTGGVLTAEQLIENTASVFMFLPIAFWITAGTLDLLYYHRLLIGAVDYGVSKFDKNLWFQEQGYFGLTSTIRKSISPAASWILVLLYYLLPMLAVIILLFLWLS